MLLVTYQVGPFSVICIEICWINTPWDLLNSSFTSASRFSLKKYCLMALHSYLTVKVIQIYKFDSYASPRALFKNRKLYFSLESRGSAWGFLVRPWATNSRPSYIEEFEEPAESCIKVCIVSCFIHPKFFCQSGLILKVKALFWRAQSLAKLILKKKKETDIKVKTFVKTGP